MRKTLNPFTTLNFVNEAWHDECQLLRTLVNAIAQRTEDWDSFAAAIEEAARLPGFHRFFEYDPAAPAASFRPKQSLLFPAAQPLNMLIISPDKRCDESVLEQHCLPLFTQEKLRLAASSLEWLAGEQQGTAPWPELLTCLEELGCLLPEDWLPQDVGPAYRRNGIHRLQHASLLYVHNGASILIDPVLHSSGYGMAGGDPQLLEASRNCSAILISHSHGDHFEPTSLAFFPRETPVVVPKVDRANILTPSFVAPLRALGFQQIIELPWNEAVRFGEISVTATPFYGEQPRSSGTVRHPALRNIGNTYLIETAMDRSWIIVDTGDEVAHRMLDVAHAIVRERGRVNHVASNLGVFRIRVPSYVSGSGSYWLCLNNRDQADFSRLQNESVTLGPKGVAQIILACECDSFIPYADWWGEIGQPSDNQEVLTGILSEELKTLGSQCLIEELDIGGSVLFG